MADDQLPRLEHNQRRVIKSGWRRAVDAIFRELPVVFLPGYKRGHVRVEDYLRLIEQSTYRGDRVRPTRG